MAIFCLSESLDELKERLGRIIVAYTCDRKADHRRRPQGPRGDDRAAEGRLQPNLVQTLENNPAFIHGGPFANIAHGCNSVIATKLAMRLVRVHGDRGRFRRRPGGGEVLQHQVPQGRDPPRRRRDRGHGPGAEAPRRRRPEGDRETEPRGPGQGRREPQEAHREHPPLRPAGRRGDQCLFQRHGRRRSNSSRTSAPIWA